MRNSRYWMGQTTWFMDDAGSRENSGADAAHPIPEIERQFRMGPNPEWTANEYHLRYLTDTDSVALRGNIRPNSAIFLHGSATNGVGQSTLYNGTIDTLATLAYTSNQPWDITSTGLATSWTADAGGLINKRVRLTSGSTGAKGFSLKDLTGKKARMSEFTAVASFSNPFTRATASASPAGTNTFVVERLTSLSKVFIDVNGRPSPNSNIYGGVVFDSLDVGTTWFAGSSSVPVVLDGCIFRSATNIEGMFATLVFEGCLFTAATFPRSVRLEMYGCSSIVSFFQAEAISALVVFRHMAQAGGIVMLVSPGNDNHAALSSLGVFDSTVRPALTIKSPQGCNFQNTGALWGSGNTQASIDVRPGCSFHYQNLGLSKAANFPITTSAVSDVLLGRSNRTSIEAFDASLGIYTPARLLSFDNLMATIANGGFCQAGFPGSPQVMDALTGAAFMPID